MLEMTRKNTWTYDEITSSHINMLRIVALVPFKNKTLTYYRTQLIRFNLVLPLVMTIIIYMCYSMRMLMHKQIEVDSIAEFTSILNATVGYMLMLNRRKKILELLYTYKHIWTFITSEESMYVRNFERKVYCFRKFMIIIATSTSILFTVPYYFTNFPSDFRNNTESFQLPLKFYYEIKSPLQFKIILLFQSITFISGTIVLCGIHTIANFLVFMLCGYLKILQERFLSVYNKDKNKSLNNDKGKNINILTFTDVKMNVHFHQQIMLLCEEVKEFLRSYYLLTVCTNIFNMSILGLKMVESNRDLIQYGTVFALCIFSFFSCQWAPDYLLRESTAVGQAAYFASFNKVRNGKQVHTALCFMMLRSQNAIQMTAGSYIKLSIETFGSMTKNAFSAFTIFRKFN